MSQYVRPRSVVISALAATLASVVVGSAFAANVVGTAKNDTLRGTAKADRLLGRGGNDKLFGLGGGDVLNGGPGNDVLVGGPGADKLACGPGRDTAMADALDKVAADCEAIKGLPKPELSVADASMREGNAGVQPMSFSVTLDKASPLPVTVSLATANGTAAGGSDYKAFAGQLVFAPGEKSKKVMIAIAGDTEFEADETFTLGLSNPVNATLGAARATGTILNEDVQEPKAGRYSGSSAQGKSVAFDVDAEVTGLTAVSAFADLTCQEAPIVLRNFPIDLEGFAELSADWRFTIAVSDTDSDGDTISIAFNGVLGVSGPASGMLRVDIMVNTSAGPVHCSSGDVSWTASPPA
jgi:hypothetical protein